MPQLRDVDKRPCGEDRALVVSLSLTSWLWNSTRLPFTGCHPRALSVTFDDARGQEQHGGHGSAGSRTFRYGRQNLKSITHSITTPWHDRCLNGYSAWPHFHSSSFTERALNAILLTSGGVSAADNEITACAISGAHLSWKTLVLISCWPTGRLVDVHWSVCFQAVASGPSIDGSYSCELERVSVLILVINNDKRMTISRGKGLLSCWS